MDRNYETTASVLFDALFVPGGRKSIDTLVTQGDAIHFVNEMFRHCKPIGASGEGVDLLAAAQIKGVQLAQESGDRPTVADGVVTVRTSAGMKAFTDGFVNAIAQHRHWGREKKMEVPA